jgi:hypothetical protein
MTLKTSVLHSFNWDNQHIEQNKPKLKYDWTDCGLFYNIFSITDYTVESNGRMKNWGKKLS